jgi:hypothetical protein
VYWAINDAGLPQVLGALLGGGGLRRLGASRLELGRLRLDSRVEQLQSALAESFGLDLERRQFGFSLKPA